MKVLKAVTAGLLILLIIVAPPFLLVRYIGNPWPPEGVDLSSPLTDNAILGLVAVLVWILWAQFTLSLIVEAYAAIADKSVDVRLPVFGFQQDLARVLVGAAFATLALAPTVAGAATSTAAADTPTHAPTVTTSQVQHSAPVRAPTTTPQTSMQQEHQQRESKPVQVHVERGDTLWSMAERYLGDGDKWTVIAEANQGKKMVDGRVFTSADQIRPGWVLTIPGAAGVDEDRGDIPADHTVYQVQPGDSLSSIAEEQLGDRNAFPAIFAASQGITQPGGKTLTNPDHIEPEWTLAIPADTTQGQGRHRDNTGTNEEQQQSPAEKTTPEPKPKPENHETAPPEPEEATPSTEVEPTVTAEPNSTDNVAPENTAPAQVDDVDEDAWPVKTVGGVGAVLGGLLIGLVARRRVAQRRRRKPGERLPLPEAAAERVETDVRAVADEVGVEFVDQALRSLSAHTVTSQTALPQLQAARMTPQQLDLYFSTAPEHDLPAPWQATSDPAVWVLPVDQRHLLDSVEEGMPALWPALVSVGHDSEGGVIMLNLAQLQGLAVTGDHHLTSQVMIALAVELGTAPWAADIDLTVIGSLVELADVLDRGRMRYVPTSHNVRFESERVHVVIAMSPLSSDQEQQLLDRGASVVIQTPTIEGQEHHGWTIDLIDAEHATVQPIGLQINPQRVDSATYAAILDMLTASLADPMRPGQDQVLPFDRGHSGPQPPAPRPAADDPSSRHPSMRGRTGNSPTAPTVGVGSDSRAPQDLGHHMVDGNTLTATRTTSEPSLSLVEPDTGRHQERQPQVDVADEDEHVDEPTPELEPELEQGQEDLVDAGDVPSEVVEPAAAAEETLDQVDEISAPVEAEQAAPVLSEPAAETETTEHPMIRLMGPTVEIVGTQTDAPTSESHLRVCTRVATYLALNPETTRTAMIEAIWNGRRVSSSTVDSRISQLRNWLGDNPDTDEAYLPRRSLRFSDAVTTDWAQFIDLVGLDPTQAPTEALENAVRLIRGRPLEGEESKHYGFAEYFAQDMIDILADATYELARRRFMAGEWNTAGSAASLGIRVDPGNEALWRLRIHAAHSAGDAAGITEAIDRMHARITELGFELDEQTTELLDAIANHDADALAEARSQI
jgi:nucleoid-associated protein YgaU